MKPLSILVFGEGISFAHVSRAFMVAQALRTRGARVRFVTSSRYVSWALRRGLDAVAVYTPDADRVYSRLRELAPMYTREEIEQCVRDDLAQIEAFEADVIVGDCRNSLRISSEVSGVPYVAISNANCTPWFAGVINAPSALPLNRVLNKQRVDRYIMPWLGKPIRNAACRMMNKPFAAAQRTFGARRPCGDFRVMFTSDQLHLLADLPQFQPTDELPSHARYIGPLYWTSDAEHAPSTRGLLERVDDARPLVYVSMGSSGLHAIWEALAPTLARLPYEFIVTAANSAAQADWGENVHVQPFVSAPLVLSKAAAVVCHGGNGTVYQALAHGVPVIAVPSFFDQEIQADQLTHHGLGLRLEPAEAAEHFEDALQRMLTEPAYADRLKRWQAWMSPWQAAEAAADAVEQFATTDPTELKHAHPIVPKPIVNSPFGGA